MARPKIRKWLRRLGIVAAAVLLLVLLAWALKVPERLAGFVLGRILGASVTIEKLDVHSIHSLTAQGIAVQGMEGLESASADVVQVEGSLRRALQGEIDRLQVAGARAVLLLPSPFLEGGDEESSFRIHALQAEGVEVSFQAVDGSSSGPFHGTAQLQEVGSELRGQAEIRADAAPLTALLHSLSDPGTPLDGALQDLRAVVHFDPQPGAAADLRAEGSLGALSLVRGEGSKSRLTLAVEDLTFDLGRSASGDLTAILGAARAAATSPAGEELHLAGLQAEAAILGTSPGPAQAAAATGKLQLSTEAAELRTGGPGTGGPGTGDHGKRILPPPSFVAVGRQEDDGAWRVDLTPQLPMLDRGEAHILWHPQENGLREIQGEAQGIHLDALSAWIPGLTGWNLDGLEVTGLANLEVSSHPTGALPADGLDLEYHITAQLPRLVVPTEIAARIPGASARIPGASTRGSFRQVKVEASGTVPLANPVAGGPMEVSFSAAEGGLPAGLLPAQGSFSGRIQLAAPLSLKGAVTATTAKMGRLEGRGSLALAEEGGAGQPAFPTGSWTWTWKSARLAAVLALLRTLEVPIPNDLQMDGRIGAAGSLTLAKTLSLEGRFQLAEGAAAAQEPVPWVLEDLGSEGRFAWNGERLRIADLRLEANAEVPPLKPTPFTIEATGSFNSGSGAGDLSALTLDAGGLGTLSAVGQVSPQGQLRSSLTVAGSQLGALRDFLRPLTGEFASGLTIQGTAKAELSLTGEGETWTLEGPATVEGSGFSSEDGSRVLEGFESQWQTKIEGSTSKAVATRLVASADVTGFQLLWGLFYGDFSALESSLSLDGTLEPIPEEEDVTFPPWHLDVAWIVPEGPSLGIRLDRDTATLEKADLRYTMALRLEDLERSYGRYLQGPLTDSSPRFAQVHLAGDLGADLHGAFLVSGGTTMAGRLLAEGLLVQGIEGQVAVRDFDLNLPVDLAWSAEGKLRRQLAAPAGEAPLLQGMVQFESADLQGFRLPPLRSVLWVRGDEIRVKETVAMPLAGGRIAFQGLTLIDLLAPERFAETALLIEGLDLEKLAAGLSLPPLEGIVDGQLPRVRLDATTLQVDGGGEASLFGGTVRIGGISGENVLSRFPKVTFSADFQDIDLSQLSRRFDVGEMNGTLQGSVEGCELFRWVPVRCSGLFETVQRKGVKRNISVKAINNIAILGTGQGLGFLDKGIRSFFDKYTYSRLGISMTLKNDVFLLRGLEHRGDKELFLRGRLPFPIDVVNAQPGRTVSFQTMLRRLQTLDFSKATSSPTGGG